MYRNIQSRTDFLGGKVAPHLTIGFNESRDLLCMSDSELKKIISSLSDPAGSRQEEETVKAILVRLLKTHSIRVKYTCNTHSIQQNDPSFLSTLAYRICCIEHKYGTAERYANAYIDARGAANTMNDVIGIRQLCEAFKRQPNAFNRFMVAFFKSKIVAGTSFDDEFDEITDIAWECVYDELPENVRETLG